MRATWGTTPRRSLHASTTSQPVPSCRNRMRNTHGLGIFRNVGRHTRLSIKLLCRAKFLILRCQNQALSYSLRWTKGPHGIYSLPTETRFIHDTQRDIELRQVAVSSHPKPLRSGTCILRRYGCQAEETLSKTRETLSKTKGPSDPFIGVDSSLWFKDNNSDFRLVPLSATHPPATPATPASDLSDTPPEPATQRHQRHAEPATPGRVTMSTMTLPALSNHSSQCKNDGSRDLKRAF